MVEFERGLGLIGTATSRSGRILGRLENAGQPSQRSSSGNGRVLRPDAPISMEFN